jgi:rhodanese-related sulfurtransferase
MTDIPHVSADQLTAQGEHLLLDVRTAAEHQREALALPHIHVPMDELDIPSFAEEHQLSNSKIPLCILCRGGHRASQVASAFHEHGFHNVYIVEGGLLACIDSGLPIITAP